jgi:membrane fusion protein, copper/silver efflux system
MTNRQRLTLAPYWFLLAILTVELGACTKPDSQATVANIDFWTCAMHPAVHSRKPGKCPICGMDLIPVENRKAESSIEEFKTAEFTVPIERQQQMGVACSEARIRPVRFEVRTVGTIEADKAQEFECVARVDGYVEQLQVTSPGEHVKAGQQLLTIYSSDLRAPEQELINLLKVQANGSVPAASLDQLFDSARRRLKYLNVSPIEISDLERTQQPTDRLLFRSPCDGVVSEAPMKVGTAVKPGDKLMTLLDLSHLWVWAFFYENEVGLLKAGQPATITLPAFPDHLFTGNISVISPTIDPANGTVKVRIDIPNPADQLKPGMHADIIVEVDGGEGVTIPYDSVLPTGSRMLVFIDKGAGKFEPRFIQVGRQFAGLGDRKRFYQVTSGLKEGDRVVSSANFLIDAEAQIQGALREFGEEKMPER